MILFFRKNDDIHDEKKENVNYILFVP